MEKGGGDGERTALLPLRNPRRLLRLRRGGTFARAGLVDSLAPATAPAAGRRSDYFFGLRLIRAEFFLAQLRSAR